MCLCDLDLRSDEEFAQNLLAQINGACTTLMISVGHRTRLFDIMDGLKPSTYQQIAEVSGLQERYVQEWLGAMVVARIVEYDSESRLYRLPPVAANFLTRRAVPNNMAASAQFVPLLGSVEDSIVECFSRGGGVPYEAYGRFHQVMAEESAQTVVYGLQSAIIPMVPGLHERLQEGISVLDIGCGSGKALKEMAKNYPASHFTGYDFSPEAIAVAYAEAKGLANLHFEVHDVASLEDSRKFDMVTAFDAIHDQAHPDRVLAGIRKALKAGGLFLMQDIRSSSHLEKNLDHPFGPFLYAVSCLHCMTVSLAQGGAGLGATWGEEKALEMLQQAGFAQVQVKRLEHDVQNNYYVCPV